MWSSGLPRIPFFSEPSLEVDAFLEGVMTLPLSDWCDASSGETTAGLERATTALAAALTEPGLALDVWRVRDDVATACFRFECAEGRALCRDRGGMAGVRIATERAALALLVRPDLREEDFRLLYGGFQRVVPVQRR